jgi:hypothetical protein
VADGGFLVAAVDGTIHNQRINFYLVKYGFVKGSSKKTVEAVGSISRSSISSSSGEFKYVRFIGRCDVKSLVVALRKTENSSPGPDEVHVVNLEYETKPPCYSQTLNSLMNPNGDGMDDKSAGGSDIYSVVSLSNS